MYCKLGKYTNSPIKLAWTCPLLKSPIKLGLNFDLAGTNSVMTNVPVLSVQAGINMSPKPQVSFNSPPYLLVRANSEQFLPIGVTFKAGHF